MRSKVALKKTNAPFHTADKKYRALQIPSALQIPDTASIKRTPKNLLFQSFFVVIVVGFIFFVCLFFPESM